MSEVSWREIADDLRAMARRPGLLYGEETETAFKAADLLESMAAELEAMAAFIEGEGLMSRNSHV